MSGSIGALALRMIVSLGVVLALMWVAARVLAGRSGKGGLLRAQGARRPARGGVRSVAPRVDVVARTSLSKTATVAVVEACGRTMVLGVTPQGISVLASDDAPLQAQSLDVSPVLAEGQGIVTAPLLDAGVGYGRTLRTAPTAGRMPTALGRKPVLDALRERTVRRP